MSSPYNDKYNVYWDSENCCSNTNIEYSYPNSFEDRTQSYLQMKQNPSYGWNAGDTVSITFDIETILNACGTELPVSIDELDFSNYVLDIMFFNSRKEEMLTYEAEFSNRVTVFIDKKTSDNYFPSGIYYCSVRLRSKDLTSPCAISTVLLGLDDGLTYVN